MVAKATTTAPKQLIYKAMIAILKDMGAIEKSSRNKTQGFQYRGIDDVYAALHPLLAKHKVFMLPEVVGDTREERPSKNGGVLAFTTVLVKYNFVAEDGSFVSCVMKGEGMDSGDKSTMKAMSIAHKYAILQTFSIPTQDIVDPDSETVEPAPVIRSLTSAEINTLDTAALKGSKVFRVAWRGLEQPFMATVEQTARWKSIADAADVPEAGEEA